MLAFLTLGIAAVFTLELDWAQVREGIKRIPWGLSRLAYIDFSEIKVTLTALCESISVAILATVYSMCGGLGLASLVARNLSPSPWLGTAISAFLTLIRAIPSIIWVLLVLVCVGFGPAAGIIGICLFSTSFFTRAFSMCFEEVSLETLEALRATGASRAQVFFGAVLPSAFTGILAWTAISIENNFGASAVLGTVGAGGIGWVISFTFGRYDYGQAMLAIGVVMIFTYLMEIAFTRVKERNAKLN